MITSHIIYLEKGKVGGKDVWCYVKVAKIKVPLYLKSKVGEKIDIKKYGQVIFSGWGKTPTPEIEKQIRKYTALAK